MHLSLLHFKEPLQQMLVVVWNVILQKSGSSRRHHWTQRWWSTAITARSASDPLNFRCIIWRFPNIQLTSVPLHKLDYALTTRPTRLEKTRLKHANSSTISSKLKSGLPFNQLDRDATRNLPIPGQRVINLPTVCSVNQRQLQLHGLSFTSLPNLHFSGD